MFSGQEWHCNVTLLYFWALAENKRADQTASHTSGGIQWIYWTVQSLDNWRGEITWQIQNPTTKQRVSIPTWGQPVTHRHTHTFTHTLARSVTLSRTHSHTRSRRPHTLSYLNLSILYDSRLTKWGALHVNLLQQNWKRRFRTGQSLITQNSRYTVTVDVCLLTLVHFHDTILNFL